MLSFVLGTIVVIVLLDAIFNDGKIRVWAWDRIKKSGKKKP